VKINLGVVDFVGALKQIEDRLWGSCYLLLSAAIKYYCLEHQTGNLRLWMALD